MDDLTQLKIEDFYTSKLVRVKTRDELTDWLVASYKEPTDDTLRSIRKLGEAVEQDNSEGIKWWGHVCGLSITPKKKARRKAK